MQQCTGTCVCLHRLCLSLRQVSAGGGGSTKHHSARNARSFRLNRQQTSMQVVRQPRIHVCRRSAVRASRRSGRGALIAFGLVDGTPSRRARRLHEPALRHLPRTRHARRDPAGPGVAARRRRAPAPDRPAAPSRAVRRRGTSSMSISPARSAIVTAWTRLLASSFTSALLTWVCTVVGESKSMAAILAPVLPRATSVSTSRSRSVRVKPDSSPVSPAPARAGKGDRRDMSVTAERCDRQAGGDAPPSGSTTSSQKRSARRAGRAAGSSPCRIERGALLFGDDNVDPVTQDDVRCQPHEEARCHVRVQAAAQIVADQHRSRLRANARRR